MAVERLLLETGDYLLLESGGGDKLLLESSTAGGTTHATTGALIGPGSTVDGAAAHIAIHGTSGALTGAGAVIAGTAARVAGAVTHETSGALVGPGSLLDGAANGPAVLTAAGGGGWLPRMRRKTRKELHAERVRLGILPPDVVKAAQKAASVVLDEPSPVKAYRADPEAVNRVFLRELGATKMMPDYTRAIQIQIELMQQEEEEILLLL